MHRFGRLVESIASLGLGQLDAMRQWRSILQMQSRSRCIIPRTVGDHGRSDHPHVRELQRFGTTEVYAVGSRTPEYCTLRNVTVTVPRGPDMSNAS